MVTSVKPKKILGFDAPIIINLYICLRQGLQHVKPKLLFQNHFVTGNFQEINNVQSCNVLRKYLDLMPINHTYA
jgi:hypothetical protein